MNLLEIILMCLFRSESNKNFKPILRIYSFLHTKWSLYVWTNGLDNNA